MSKKTIFYIAFFSVLIVGFYIVMTRVTDIGKPQLPVLNTVMPFSFTRQDGQQISNKDVVGKTVIVEYFFTTCKGICPKMNRNMVKVYNELKNEKDFLILSHTVDPETDSVATLKRYADSIGAQPQNWWFLTGSKAELYRTARESYILDDPKNSSKNISEQFLHTQFFCLVDRDGVVRGIYDGLKKDEVDQIIADAKLLLHQR
ncbi:MAG TPA: SCO family protein [Chitinophagaceae bacterium]|nr:SCO family protein [Chitinophagaceae bacterium]